MSRALHKLHAGPDKEGKYVILGEKAKAQLIRDSKKDIEISITELQKNPLNYTQVSVLADDILKNVEYDALRIVFNKFQSVVSFLPTTATVLWLNILLTTFTSHNPHMKAGSIGALAGFAIAILFTWKFLRSPVRLRRRKHKETGSASTSNALSSLSEKQPIESTKEIEPPEDLYSPAKFALAQGVKKKLYGSRKMTCQLLGVILEESTPEELQGHATVRSSVVEVLLEICKFCDIYLMERVLDDESGERVISALQNVGLFKTGGLMKDKVLFCSTENGRSSFVRQLEPDWHVDTNPEVLSQLSRFVRNPLYISPARSSFASGSNVLRSTSLELYFAE